MSILTQTQMDSKPPPDKPLLMSWQRGACSACCPDILLGRANSHKWPPSASGLRAQTLMSARGVLLRTARTAISDGNWGSVSELGAGRLHQNRKGWVTDAIQSGRGDLVTWTWLGDYVGH